MVRKKFLDEIKRSLLSVDDKAVIILFGSRARGDASKDSDWDFLVVTHKKAAPDLQNIIRDKMYNLELAYSQPLSTIIFDRAEWSKISTTGFYENVMKEGQTL